MDYPRRELTDHVAGRDNISLLASRQQAKVGFRHAWAAIGPANDCVVSTTSREANQVFPLYRYPNGTSGRLSLGDETWPADKTNGNRVPNLKPEFIAAISVATNIQFVPSPAAGPLGDTQFAPVDVLGYIYAILHCPSYRALFAEFLRMDFPRIPVTSDSAQFRALSAIGKRLLELHTVEAAAAPKLGLQFPIAGGNAVIRRQVRYAPPTSGTTGRVYFNADQYIDGVPLEVWEFEVGGFQVADKWLKDRAGRALTFDELMTYQAALQSIACTIDLVAEIEALIPSWPVK